MILELALFVAAAPRQDPVAPPETPTVSIETEVLHNVKNQPLGKGTVDDLALPDEFLNRVSDRIIRKSFEERFRVVVPDPPVKSALPEKNASQPVDSTTFQPPSAMNLPLVIGTILLLAFVAYIAITARARKETPL
jgi:hypothetical protein